MARGNAIAAAVLASAGSPGSSGSGRSVPGGLSPLVASYTQQYSVNRPYSPLPRPANVFLDGAFGPFTPITPMPIDPPREDSGRPDPRRYQYRPGVNLPTGTPGDEDKLVPFAVLRRMADAYSVARSCVEKRKQEIVGLEWDVIPTPEAEHSMADDDKVRADWEQRRAKVVDFFSHPDSDRAKYPTFGAWLNAILEDRFVIDAVAIHLVPPRKKGSGLFGSDLAALNVLAGDTIRPLLSTLAETPPAPSPAYEQYIFGVPRVDMISVISGNDDLQGLGEPVANFRADQLIYLRETPRAFTQFGYSLVEKAILPIRIGMARQEYQAAYFSESTLPAIFLTPGPDISSPQQIRQLQEAINSLTDIGSRHRVIVLPPGSKTDPQKSAPLADQFDEWIISQVAMPFGLTPMDLGVTPRVSAIQTPSESKQLSEINTDKGSQTRIEPTISDLKAVIFDFVIQDLFKQKDMEWSWGLTDRGKNREQAIQEHIQLITAGIESIDEARTDLGNTPWGLPETSVPLILTPAGPVPLSAIAGDPALAGDGALAAYAQQPPQAAGQQQPQAVGQPKQQAAIAGAPRQSDDALTTPAHEAAQKLPATPEATEAARKSAADQAAELEILARYLRHGRDPEKFTAKSLPQEAVEAAVRALPFGVRAAVKAAESAAEAKKRQERREEAIAAAAAAVTAKLGKLVAANRQEKLSTAHVVDQAVDVMAEGYDEAMRAGTSDASGDYDDTPEVDFSGQAQDRAAGQRGYFLGLLQDIIGGLSIAATTARLGLYAATLRGSYNQAYGMTVMQAHPDYYIVWQLGDANHCQPCIDRAGKQFTLDTLPGWPGDGGFGGSGASGRQNVCLGGPACKCSCFFVQGGQALSTGTNTQQPIAQAYYQQQNATITAARQQAAVARADFVSSLPTAPGIRAATRDQLRQQVADLANARIQASGGYSGISVYPQDVPAKIIAAMLPPEMAGAAGASFPQVNVEQAVELMFAKASAKLDMTKAEFAAIVKGVLDDVAGANAPKADPGKVYAQLARNYRPEGIGWVRETVWYGPVAVPLDRIDWENLGTWAAAHDDSHVAHFEAEIKAGNPPAPAVMVQVPGQPLLRVIDGHHRSDADRKLGRPVLAWVGLASSDSPTAPEWRTHLYQTHSGGDPLNKALGDEDPSRVAFLLIRALNESGKLRYLLQLRDDGSWGLPGGKCHDGEVPWDAAVRESTEELGSLPGVEPSAMWTRAEDDHVVFTYLASLPELFAPSGDGDGETAGWGWFRKRDVAELPLHPAMRVTWEALDFSDPQLGGTPVRVPAPASARSELIVPADAAGVLARKEARGYDLSPLSGMISLDVPDGLVEPVPGGVTGSQHVTVAYLGKGLTDAVLAEACRRAASAAALVPGPLDGVISGRGTFPPSESSDGKVVVWAGITLPGAEVLREALADLSASQFTQWSPHITRAYISEGDELPDPVPATPVTFTHLSVHRSDGKLFRFTLGGTDTAGEPHDGDESTCPCGTPVAYDWANGWQHADGSVSHDDGESVSDKMTRS